MLPFATVANIGFSCARMLLLLMAFGLSFAGQLMAGAAMASQTAPTTTPTAAAAAGSCGYGGTSVAIAPRCAARFCSSVPIIPTSAANFGPAHRAMSVAASYAIGPGIVSRPDPHPPKFLLV